LLVTAITQPLQHKDHYGESHETHITLTGFYFVITVVHIFTSAK